MQIERLQIVLKPRTTWEAADLGIKLAVRWFPRLVLASTLTALPFLFIAFRFDAFVSQVIFLWWFKPLYERSILMVLSVSVFDGKPSLREIARGFADSRLWFYVSLYRLSWYRAENGPIDALEEVDFESQARRRKGLYQFEERLALLITIFGLAFEIVLFISIVSFFQIVMQSDFNSAYTGTLKLLNINELGVWESRFLLVAIYISISISAVFYVSAGFATYLNRRTIMEGWDIELGFKKLVNRLSIVLLALAIVIPNGNALANDADRDVDTILDEVLSQPEFNQMTTVSIPTHLKDWIEDLFRIKHEEPKRTRVGPLANFLATLLKVLLITVLITGLVLLFYRLFTTYGAEFFRNRSESTRSYQTVPVKKLPSNLVREIRERWSTGRFREAMALLYQASVAHVDQTFNCRIRESDTEGDCLRKTRGIEANARASFREITTLWLRVAYGDVTPSESTFHGALDDFEKHILNATT